MGKIIFLISTLIFLALSCAPEGGTQKCACCDAPADPGSSYCINHKYGCR